MLKFDWTKAFSGTQGHACSKLIDSVCSYHPYLATCKVRCQSIQKILAIKEYSNLIGCEHSWLQLENEIFGRHTVFPER